MSLASSFYINALLIVMIFSYSEAKTHAMPLNSKSLLRFAGFQSKGHGPQLLEGDVYAHWSRDKSYRQDSIDFFDPALKWDPENIPYFIDDSLMEAEANVTERIEEAFFEFSKHTCLKFRALRIEDFETWPIDYLLFNISTEGCFSFIGRRGGAQPISLKPNSCIYKGIIMHEIFHSLGFGHEHNRPDRDEAINIKWDLVDPTKTSYLNKYNNYLMYGESYDHGSLSHGNNKLYSVNDNWTLVATNDSYMTLGQRDGLSDGDIRRLNAHYSCPMPSPSTTNAPTTQAMTKSTTRRQNKTMAPSSPSTTSTTTSATTPTMPKCNGLTPSFADPEDCTKFYVCQGLRAIQMDCPAGLYYNSELFVCDWPWAVECDSPPAKAVSVLIF